MENVKPCKLCGAKPITASTERIFAYRHGNMMLGWVKSMFICPNCGLKSAANEYDIKNIDHRSTITQIELWNKAQEYNMKDKIRSIIEKLNSLIKGPSTFEIRMGRNETYKVFSIKKFILSEKNFHTFNTITYEDMDSSDNVKGDETFNEFAGISAILEDNTIIDLLFVDVNKNLDDVRCINDALGIYVYIKDESRCWYTELDVKC